MSEKNIDQNSTLIKANTILNTITNVNTLDPDEQFVLDIIRKTKQESIENLTDLLRAQETKSVMLIRILERYKQQLETNK